MPKLTAVEAMKVYCELKKNNPKKAVYNEEVHCPLVIEVFADPDRGTMSAFIIAAYITENTYWNWRKNNPMFDLCAEYGRALGRENWEEMGRNMKHSAVIGSRFEYWRVLGYTRYGISKNPRIRLDLTPDASPMDHYKELINQAGRGDFTAGEVKQLAEAINLGMNAHQNFELQKQINDLKADLKKVNEINHGDNTIPNKPA